MHNLFSDLVVTFSSLFPDILVRWPGLGREYFDRPMDLGSFVDRIQAPDQYTSYFYYSEVMQTFGKIEIRLDLDEDSIDFF